VPASAVAEEAVRNVVLGVLDPELGDNIVDPGSVQVIEIDPRSGRIVTEAIPLVELVHLHRPAGFQSRRSPHPHAGATGPRRLPRSDTLKQRQGALSR
jgi:hypothetical protein